MKNKNKITLGVAIFSVGIVTLYSLLVNCVQIKQIKSLENQVKELKQEVIEYKLNEYKLQEMRSLPKEKYFPFE